MTATTATKPPAPSERAADFINALGVNIHIGQTGDGPAAVITDTAYLGLTNVRNQAIGPKTSASEIAAIGQLANDGLKFDWLTGGALGVTMSALDTFLKAHPGSISAIEGPNEVNNFPITFNGLTGSAAATAYQNALYAAVKADPLTASIPVLDFTGSSSVAGVSGVANGHPYPKGGNEPLAQLSATYAKFQSGASAAPIYFTEAGYFTLPGLFGWEGVNQGVQAKLTLNLIMDAAKLGVNTTYIYDLIDDGADPTNSIAADHFGLFTLNGQAKPSALAIHDLTAILADPGAAAKTFTPTALNYTVAGLPTSGSSLVLEKSSGVYDIIVWAEPTIWNATTHTAIAAPSEAVTVNFGAVAGQASVFDPLVSTAAIKTLTNTSAVTITLTDHPMIIQVSNFAQAMASFVSAHASAPSIGAIITASASSATPSLIRGHG